MAAQVLTVSGVAQAIGQYRGNLAAVGRHFGVRRQAVHSFVNRRPGLRQAYQSTREEMKDNAESALYSAILRGEAWAVCFYLKTQGRDRGYVERQEHEVTGKDGRPIVVSVKLWEERDAGDIRARARPPQLGPPGGQHGDGDGA